MGRPSALLVVAFAAVAAVPLAGSAHAEDDAARIRVLFVGNSYTRFHGLHRTVARLARSDPDAPRVRTARETRPGGTLRRHWLRGAARERIRSGAYSHVVLQGHSLRPVDRPDELRSYVRRFDELIRRVGSETVLYATWPREPGHRFYLQRGDALPNPMAMQRLVDGVYGGLAEELDARLAPVGVAFLRAGHAVPEVGLYGRDGFHPSREGSYLSACVLYATITGRDPRVATYVPWPMEPALGARLRAVAASITEHTLTEP